MALVRATKWAREYFSPGPPPTQKTIKSWIRKGELNGEIRGAIAWVDPINPWKNPEDKEGHKPKSLISKDNPLLANLSSP